MTRTAEEIAQGHAACLNGASTINSVIATHNKGSGATSADFGHEMTHDEKKARVSRSVGYLKYQKTFTDWTSESFTEIDAAITAADAFTG
tara:strand:- start:170 stop:439 length:270 start_codon:yes stop_codon:yes gene_type:complete